MPASFDLIKINAPVSGGLSKVYAHGLGEVPKVAIFLYGHPMFSDSDLNIPQVGIDIGIGFGAMDGTRQWSFSGHTDKSGTSHDADRYMSSDHCISRLDDGNTLDNRASFNSWDENDFTLDWTGLANNDSPIFVALIGGDDVNAYVGEGFMQTDLGNQSYSGVADGKALITYHVGGLLKKDVIDTGFGAGIGFGVSSVLRAGVTTFYANASQDQGWEVDDDTMLLGVNSIGNTTVDGDFHEHDPVSGFTIDYDVAAAGSYRFGWIHLGGDGIEALAGDDLIDASTKQINTTGLFPRLVFGAVGGTGTGSDASGSDDNSFSIGIGEVLTGDEYGISINSEANTTDEAEYDMDVRMVLRDPTASGSEQDGGHMVTGGATEEFFTIGRVVASNFRLFWLALGTPPAVTLQEQIDSAGQGSATVDVHMILHEQIDSAGQGSGELTDRTITIIRETLDSAGQGSGVVTGMRSMPFPAGFEDVEDFGMLSTFGLGELAYVKNPVVRTLVQFPDDSLYYSDAEIKVGSDRYYNRLSAIPSVNGELPEFYAGLEAPLSTQITFENLDKAIGDLRIAGKLKRGNKVLLKEIWDGDNLDTPEVSDLYEGSIDFNEPGVDFVVNAVGLDLGNLEGSFPDRVINTDEFPDAFDDLGAWIPYIIAGTQKKVPCALIEVDQASSPVLYKYLVGEGDLRIDQMYRDGRQITKYNGNFRAGSTTTNLELDNANQESDDFYNNLFITNLDTGETQRITDYDGGSNEATCTAFSSPPLNSHDYEITRWKKTTSVIATYTHTFVEFATPQVDLGGSRLTRRNMSADVYNLTEAERNPGQALKTTLTRFGSSLDMTSFTTAVGQIDSLGTLFVDGGYSTPEPKSKIVHELALIGRSRIFRDVTSGDIAVAVDGFQSKIFNKIDHLNTVSVGVPKQETLDALWKNVQVRFRRQLDSNNYTGITDQFTAVADGKIVRVENFNLVFDKGTAGHVADYMSNMKAEYDEIFEVTVGYAGKDLRLGALVDLDMADFNMSGTHEIVKKTAEGISNKFKLAKRNAARVSTLAGTAHPDPIGDAAADFTQTPPPPVTNLNVAWELSSLEDNATAIVTFTKPVTENYREATVSYREDGNIIYIPVETTEDTEVRIPGLKIGQLYNFRAQSINQFGVKGEVASTNSTSLGGIGTPSTPTKPVFETDNFRTIGWRTNTPADSEFVTEHEWEVRTSGLSLLDTMQGGTFLPWSETGTSSFSLVARVRRKNKYGTWGGWSSYSDPVSNDTLLSAHYSGSSVIGTVIAGSSVDENKRINMYSQAFPTTNAPTLDGFQLGTFLFRTTHTVNHNKGRRMAVTTDFAPNSGGTPGIHHSEIVTENSSNRIIVTVEIANLNGTEISGINYDLTINYW